MHNSLFTREELRPANAHGTYTRFRDPYRGLTVQPGSEPGSDEFRLAPAWRVVFGPTVDAGAATALQADVTSLFARLGIALDDGAPRAFCFDVDASLSPRDCRLDLGADRLAIAGGGTAGLWAGLAWLVWELRVRRAPVLPTGRREHRALWTTQISQGPWGGNYSVPDLGPDFLSDESLRLYAHGGVNSMMIYGDLLCYVRSDILPELNHPDAKRHLDVLRAAGRRAARYGVGFTYVPVHPKLVPAHPVFAAHPDVRGRGWRRGTHRFHCLCSTSAQALAFYREQYRRLFDAVPQLQGVLAITYSESFYHCDMWQPFECQPCPRCAPLSSDARVIPLLATVADALHEVRPDAFLAEWIYTWQPPDNGGRTLAAIHATRPVAVGVCQAVDKDPLYDGRTVYQKPGYRKWMWDYTLDYEGPTAFAAEAARCAHESARPFLAKTETGTGIEAMQLPYVPAFYHLARKWQGVRSLRPDGVHQAWLFYGHHLSRAERLAAWAAYRPDQPAEAFLAELARADFGPAAAPAALTCWARFGRAVKRLPCVHLGEYYKSPSFFGPCHPLLPDPEAPVPEPFYACLYYLQELGPSFSCRELDECRVPIVLAELPETPAGLGVHTDPGLGWELVSDEYDAAAREGRTGWETLCAAEERLESDEDRLNWREETLLAELAWRTFLSCANVVRFLLARQAWWRGDAPAALAAMRRVATAERANALAALPLYAAAPWLDPAARLDGRFPEAATLIHAKVGIVDAFLTTRPCTRPGDTLR
ncbi:MAG: hypothetical protein BWZ02_01904 [Lentisphaerae bacterium ADurb.BinA184]|nr:MAG: hypothetical protein BWZ02_01904 [Lentisphaerae bacterium ADurb.BinA184]